MEKKHSEYSLLKEYQAILPEHMYDGYTIEEVRPERTENELNAPAYISIIASLKASLEDRTVLTVKLYDPFEELQVTGLIDGINDEQGSFSVNGDWFMLSDIEGVEVYSANIKKNI